MPCATPVGLPLGAPITGITVPGDAVFAMPTAIASCFTRPGARAAAISAVTVAAAASAAAENAAPVSDVPFDRLREPRGRRALLVVFEAPPERCASFGTSPMLPFAPSGGGGVLFAGGALSSVRKPSDDRGRLRGRRPLGGGLVTTGGGAATGLAPMGACALYGKGIEEFKGTEAEGTPVKNAAE